MLLLLLLLLCFCSKKDKFKIVPIMVGNTSTSSEKLYGELLAKYFLLPNTLFVISSDFCHWGKRNMHKKKASIYRTML